MRAVLLAVFGLYLLVGPIGRQLFGARIPRGFQSWQMFAGTARETCQVRFFVAGPGDARAPLDLDGLRRVERKHLAMLERRACITARRRLGRRADVRLEARCGSRRRWVNENDGAINVCARRR